MHFSVLQHLDNIGLISLTGPNVYVSREIEGPATATYFGQKFRLELPERYGKMLDLGRVSLTATGEELAPISGAEPLSAFRDFILQRWSSILTPLMDAA